MQNRRTASSGELFILAINSSRKIVTIGENTRGIVNYGNGELKEWPGFGISISTRMCDFVPKISYETKGIPPQIKFNEVNNFDAALNFILENCIKK